MHDYQLGSALLSVQETADAFCVSAPAVHRWIADGTLPAQHAEDGTVRIRGEDVEKFLRSRVWMTPNAVEIWAPA